MKQNNNYVVNFNDETTLLPKFSIHRYWRRLHAQQRAFISIIILIFLIIFLIYPKYAIKPNKSISYKYQQEIVNKENKHIQFKDKKENQLIKVKVEKQIFLTPTNERQIAVRDAMQHAWTAYRKYAWGYDELQPISKTRSVWFGLGLTIVDSIDTLYIMNMTKEYNEARDWIDRSFSVDSKSVDKSNSHFEITIRILGGLLSIYHLTADELFLKRATELGDRLLVNFNTESGLPLAEINLKRKVASNYGWTQDLATSEVGTVQVEMRDLSRVTGDKKYENAADKSSATLHKLSKKDGLVPIAINPKTGLFSGGTVSFGARGDSYYEYLLKQWLQTGQQRSDFWDDWIECIGGVRKHLWHRAYPEKLYFVGELMSMSDLSPKMDHLACFLAGNMALGWYFHRDITYLLDMAKELTKTCYHMYVKQATGLSPEIAYFNIDSHANGSTIIVKENDAHNLLRPELIESLYYMYHITNDTMYQEWGWKIFQSFEKYTRQEYGYSSINDVRRPDNVRARDKMESYFLAETLKYFYLLFDKTNLFPFDKWLFNTEAHPLRIYNN